MSTSTPQPFPIMAGFTVTNMKKSIAFYRDQRAIGVWRGP